MHRNDDEAPGRSGTRFCEPCSKRGTSVATDTFCETCKQFQCGDCVKLHNVSAGHSFIKISDEGHQRSKALDLHGWDKCKKHGKKVKFFCKDDRELICSNCAIADHRKCHAIVEITSISSGANESLKKVQNKFNMLGRKAKLSTEQLEEMKETMIRQVEQLPLEVNRLKENVNNRFRLTREKVTKDLNEIKNKKGTEITKKEELCKTMFEESEKWIKILTDVSEGDNLENQFIAKKKLDETQRKISESCKHISEIEAVNILLEIKEPLNWLEMTGKSPGTLKISVKRNCREIIEYRSVKLSMQMSTQLIKSDDEEEEPLYTGMDFFPDGRLAVAANMNKMVKVFDVDLKTLKYSYLLTYHPQDVVVISNMELATTARVKREIDIFSVSCTDELILTRTINSSAQLQSISLGENDNFLVGLFEDVVPARYISKDGVEKDFSFSFPSRQCDNLFGHAFLWISNASKIVMCDSYEHAVFIFDTELNTTVVVKDENIRVPISLAHGPSDSVFVSCYVENGAIVQISTTGRILSMHKLNLNYPRSVAVSKDFGRLVVFSNEAEESKLHALTIIC